MQHSKKNTEKRQEQNKVIFLSKLFCRSEQFTAELNNRNLLKWLKWGF